ncbi:hypothetical protein [Actinomycetospora cinnamomea]|uniref:Uncharacterized protein n=1 Tax=Actinomycetospora cinnamomea TaxID=663609 RepID=A0A2U1F142_9PSEU|nr:hypothetical protein [Actinomycetospora cinnamomea]PVZ05882.1 hypothetical protein C8D89_114138 [Actinomycetospora cinnamomea]
MSASPSEPPSARAARIAALVDELTAEVDAGLGDGAIAALDPDAARRGVAVAGRLYAVAAEEGAHPPTGTDLTPTEAVVLATAALRAHDLNPFDLALWFSRSGS